MDMNVEVGNEPFFLATLHMPDKPVPYKLSEETRKALMHAVGEDEEAGGRFVAFITTRDETTQFAVHKILDELNGRSVHQNGLSMFYWRKRYAARLKKFIKQIDDVIDEKAIRFPVDFTLKKKRRSKFE